VQNHRSTNQNTWILHDHGAIPSRYGTNRAVTTSHSYENGSMCNMKYGPLQFFGCQPLTHLDVPFSSTLPCNPWFDWLMGQESATWSWLFLGWGHQLVHPVADQELWRNEGRCTTSIYLADIIVLVKASYVIRLSKKDKGSLSNIRFCQHGRHEDKIPLAYQACPIVSLTVLVWFWRVPYEWINSMEIQFKMSRTPFSTQSPLGICRPCWQKRLLLKLPIIRRHGSS